MSKACTAHEANTRCCQNSDDLATIYSAAEIPLLSASCCYSSGKWCPLADFRYCKLWKIVRAVRMFRNCIFHILNTKAKSTEMSSYAMLHTVYFTYTNCAVLSSSNFVDTLLFLYFASYCYRMTLCISAVFTVAQCLSISLSRWWIVSRWLKISSDFFLCLLAPSF